MFGCTRLHCCRLDVGQLTAQACRARVRCASSTQASLAAVSVGAGVLNLDDVVSVCSTKCVICSPRVVQGVLGSVLQEEDALLAAGVAKLFHRRRIMRWAALLPRRQ